MLELDPKTKKALVNPVAKISGSISVDGDKSISHRAVMLAGIANGTSEIRNCLMSDDVKSTIKCLRALGVRIAGSNKILKVYGKGRFGLRKPKKALDAGNSGTTMRLLSGVLAGQSFASRIFGDKSLSRRPMGRIAEPLVLMGACVRGREISGGIYPPLDIQGAYPLEPVKWSSKIASAQVKSAVLLAGLYAIKGVSITEPQKSRDHTERMMRAFGINIKTSSNTVVLNNAGDFRGRKIDVPGDVSSAAFFAGLCAAVKNSEITIQNIGLNATRTGFFRVLKRMGGDIICKTERVINNEPVGFIRVKSSKLKAAAIGARDIPSIVDEIPLLAVIATQARGTTVISGAGELRVKESDRLANIASELKKMGALIEEKKDGLVITGPVKLTGSKHIKSHDDHRIAMSMAVAALCARGESIIEGYDSVKISCPGFWNTLRKLKC